MIKNYRKGVFPLITIKSLVKSFYTKEGNAVNGISFEIPEGKLFTLLGPSGCGKSTTLRMIAGLEEPTDGEILLDNQLVYSKQRGINILTHKRPIGMVFQSYAIWPHMTVFENVAFPLTVESPKIKKNIIKERAEKALSIVCLEHLAYRPATALSGGQQQRVALARALIREPKVLLLDEPLSNLDAKLREQMREEIRLIQQKLAITTVYVTHDQSEALAISDLIMIMKNGEILELGPPQNIYNSPKTSYSAEFVGISNKFDGIVEPYDNVTMKIYTSYGEITLESGAHGKGKNVSVFIRPENISLTNVAPNDRKNSWEGHIDSYIYQGEYWDYLVNVKDKHVRVRSYEKIQKFQRGDTVYLYWEESKMTILQNSEMGSTTSEAS
jgi:iron(III) transport system ATP-binding protein